MLRHGGGSFLLVLGKAATDLTNFPQTGDYLKIMISKKTKRALSWVTGALRGPDSPPVAMHI